MYSWFSASRRRMVTFVAGSTETMSERRLYAWSWFSLSWISCFRVSIWAAKKVEALPATRVRFSIPQSM